MAVAQVARRPRRGEIALAIGTDEVTLAVVQAIVRCRRLGESLRSGHGNVSRHLISSTSWLPVVKCQKWTACESEFGVCRACLASARGHWRTDSSERCWRKRRGLAGLDDAISRQTAPGERCRGADWAIDGTGGGV